MTGRESFDRDFQQNFEHRTKLGAGIAISARASSVEMSRENGMQHENLKHRAHKLGLNGGDLASLANLSAPSISQFFRGRKSLDAAKVKQIDEVLDGLEKLKEYFPVPVGFHDMKLVATALERLHTGKLESFQKLTKAISWDTPEGLDRKFPRIFKEK